MDNKVIITARSFATCDNYALELLQNKGYNIIKKPDNLDAEKFLQQEIGNSVALIAGLEPIRNDLLATAKKLKIISRYGVGVDNVDLKFATQRGITVTNTPNANSESVADLAFSLIMATARQICLVDNSIRNKSQKRPLGKGVWGKTLGIIGTGAIGKGVARRGKGFNMDILLNDQFEDNNFANEINAEYTSLTELLEKSDYISLHVPFNENTCNLIDTKELKIMKPSAVIVNTSRGGIINEKALFIALTSRIIFGAGLDATVAEPPYDSPLITLDNIVLTSHIGASTDDAVNNMSKLSAENVIAILDGNISNYTVN